MADDDLAAHDDVAELASLVIGLADRLEAVAPAADAGAIEAIRKRAQRLASPEERGPVRRADLRRRG